MAQVGIDLVEWFETQLSEFAIDELSFPLGCFFAHASSHAQNERVELREHDDNGDCPQSTRQICGGKNRYLSV
jgi:hypothetical protein